MNCVPRMELVVQSPEKTADTRHLENWVGNDPTDVEIWYPKLVAETFNTEFVPLSYAATQTLVRYHGSELDEKQHDSETIAELRQGIDDAIAGFQVCKAAFVRLSTLSPKDATLANMEKLHNLMQTQLQGISAENPSKCMIAINRSLYLASRVNSGAEAMELFRLSNRVAKHLSHRLTEVTSPEQFRMNIVVREWNTIAPEFEFRGFVYQNNLCALTHYYKFLYVEKIAAYKTLILEMVTVYFNKVKHLIPLNDYVIDFSVDMAKKHVLVIELNPWSEAASSCLFNWELESDRAIMEGKAPFEFRILDRPPENLFDNVSPKIRVLYSMIHDYENVEKALQVWADKFLDTHFNSSEKQHKNVKKQNKHINFYAETSKFDFKTLTLNLNKVFTDLYIHCYGLVHWELTESFFHCIPGSKRMVQNFDETSENYLFPTLLIICFYEIESRNQSRNRNDWKNIISRAYAYVYYSMQKVGKATLVLQREALLMEVHNVLMICREQLGLLQNIH